MERRKKGLPALAMERQTVRNKLKSVGIFVTIFVTLGSFCGPVDGKIEPLEEIGANSTATSLNPKSFLILHDSSGIDREFQQELLTAAKIALQDLNDESPKEFQPFYIDLGQSNLITTAKWLHKYYSKGASNQSRDQPILSLLAPQTLRKFGQLFQKLSNRYKSQNILKIITPRISLPLKNRATKENENEGANNNDKNIPQNQGRLNSVQILSLQMSQLALCKALLNRVDKIGVKSLTPILDKGGPEKNAGQFELLQNFKSMAGAGIKFDSPIFVENFQENEKLRDLLNNGTNSGPERGILMLAKKSSATVLEITSESANLFQMRWFSPYLVEYEEYALGRGRSKGQVKIKKGPATSNSSAHPAHGLAKSTFGIYSVHYVGGKNWDNPSRRKTLRDLHFNIGASPRILSSILAYDATRLALNYLKNHENPSLNTATIQGLSGDLTFDLDGYRSNGVYFGVSAAPELKSRFVTLLQPSTWILEDTLNLVENDRKTENFDNKTNTKNYVITDYNVATSSILTKDELNRLRNSQNPGQTSPKNQTNTSNNNKTCENPTMEIMSHDPFSQMPITYPFKMLENLPEHVLIPNQYGFGISFACQHNGGQSSTTMRIACSPGHRSSRNSVKCFRSHLQRRQKTESAEDLKLKPENVEARNKRETNQFKPRNHGSNYQTNTNEHPFNPSTHYYGNYYNEDQNRPNLYRRDDRNVDQLQYMPMKSNSNNTDNDIIYYNHHYYGPDFDNQHENNEPLIVAADSSSSNSYTRGQNSLMSDYYDDEPVDMGFMNQLNNNYNQVAPATMSRIPQMTAVAAATGNEVESDSKFPGEEIRKIIRATKPFVGSCVGSATGCAMCVLFLGRFNLGTTPPACIGSCVIGIISACDALLGKTIAEHTVICTELFRQGYLDTETFLADAEFGKRINETSPTTLTGYHLLATPLVGYMRESTEVTEIVSKLALPWAQYMKYTMGYSDDFNWLGYLIHQIGSPLCFIVGYCHLLMATNYYVYIIFLMLTMLIASSLITVLGQAIFTKKIGVNKSN